MCEDFSLHTADVQLDSLEAKAGIGQGFTAMQAQAVAQARDSCDVKGCRALCIWDAQPNRIFSTAGMLLCHIRIGSCRCETETCNHASRKLKDAAHGEYAHLHTHRVREDCLTASQNKLLAVAAAVGLIIMGTQFYGSAAFTGPVLSTI